MGKTNKRKGSNAERHYAKVFRDLGFSFCKTSRQASRIHDDAGIDLMYLPINLQVKAGAQRGLNPGSELRMISERILTMFPPSQGEADKPLILVHKKEVRKGQKRDEFDEIVSMSFEEFSKLLLLSGLK